MACRPSDPAVAEANRLACPICVAKAAMPHEKRWIGDPRMSHCSDCHQSWVRTTNACHCVRCGVTFNSPSASARHDDDDGRTCLSPEALGYEPRVNIFGDKVWWPAARQGASE